MASSSITDDDAELLRAARDQILLHCKEGDDRAGYSLSLEIVERINERIASRLQTDGLREALDAIGLGDGEFFVNGDTFDLVFAPEGTNFVNAHKIVGRFACGETAYKLPGIIAGLLNQALAASPAEPGEAEVADAHKDCEDFTLPSERALREACHLADCQWTAINMMRQKGTIDPGFVRAIYAFARYIDRALASPAEPSGVGK